MIKLLLTVIVIPVFLHSEIKSIESVKNIDVKFNINKEVELPKVKLSKEQNITQGKDQIKQDIVYRFNQVKGKVWKLKNDTTWLRTDIQRLEYDAKRIASSGQQNYWFQHDLRNMAYKMSQWYNDIQSIEYDIKDLLNIAYKDKELNKIANDIDWYIRDIENTFAFDVENAARNLEYTVRSIDPKLVGYDAQWNAMDISRYARDIAYKARYLYWDSRELVNRTTP